MKNEGFSSIEYLITLIVLVSIIAVFGIFLRTASITVKKTSTLVEDRKTIDDLLSKVYEDLKKDISPEADSRFDEVWKWNGYEHDGFSITISSLSGLINLNFIPEKKIYETGLKNYFENSEGITFIEKNRQQGTLLYSYDDIKEYITENMFNKYFTFRGFANINISDINSIKIISDNIIGSSYGNELYNKINILRENRQFIQNQTELKMFLGVNYDGIMPFINLNPQININFIDEEALKALLSYSGFNVDRINQKVATIVSLRQTGEIKESELCNILGISKSDELYYYLGCKTWLWQIDINGKNTSCSIILVRVPEEDSFGKTSFYIIEKKWL